MSGKANVFLVAGKRTPFLRSSGKANDFSAVDLAVNAGRRLLLEHELPIDEVIFGCGGALPSEANIARIISLRMGISKSTPAWTVQRNCASGLQAIDCAITSIRSGKANVVIAGGAEAMSRSPLMYSSAFTKFFVDLARQKTPLAKLVNILKFRPSFLKPEISLLQGLTDPTVDLNMGVTAENVAEMFQISREEMDRFAADSHIKAIKAQHEHVLDNEIVSIYGKGGKVYSQDTGVRSDSTFEKLSTLKPAFERPYGQVTPGNSSQITDGAVVLMFASGQAIKDHDLVPISRVCDISWAGLEPKVMGLGPVHAIAKILTENNLGIDDIDYWELNEAFSTQVLGCVKALTDNDYCQKHFAQKAFGEIPLEKTNIHGGAIALGHPVGASGARISLHLSNVLNSNKSKYGIASLCIGGGQGGAILLENCG